MSTKKVVCMDPLSDQMKLLIRKNLPQNIEVVFCENDKERKLHIKSAEVLVTFTNGVSKGWITQAKSCKYIQKLGAGVNNIDIQEASRNGIFVSNTRGLNSRSVAEHAVLLMLAVYKHLITAHHNIAFKGNWLKTGLRDSSYQLTKKKVGLIGMGDIGREVVKILEGFECDLLYYDIARQLPENENKLNIKYMDLDSLLQHSDVVSLHVPLTEGTYHLIDSHKLKLMKSEAVLINTCRGGVVDEEALYQALQEKRILGAGLDVFEYEPIDQNHRLASLSNVALTPHIGGGTREAMETVIEKACSNIHYFLTRDTFLDSGDIVNLGEIKKAEGANL